MSSEIHSVAARGFGAAADSYERARPDYPRAAIDHLAAVLDLRPGTTVLDLGAGTGKLTRQLVPTGATVVAIEPVEAMRTTLVATVPGVEVIDCTAEQIAWPDGDADAVVAGQAFHWFDAERAIVDIHRVLRDRGGLGLAWNSRDDRVDWVARMNAIIDPFADVVPRHRTATWKKAFASTSLFTAFEEVEFPNPQSLDADRLVDRVASISFIAAQPVDVRTRILDDIRELAASLPADFEMPQRTFVQTCSKR